MSQCRKFAPNIFNKSKCSNCFRQKEEHSAEALECNRASRAIARSGYLFVAPDWDFSVPLNRTKRWQRRWFVLYDDGELNYSVDEHPDTVPQGSVDMCKVMEVTGAEQVTGHPHSLALTSPDRVTFIKAASREDARWWAELLAVFPRRHKRNATFPGGRASPSLPQLGRSASPQPPRPRHLSCLGPSPRTNFITPPLKEERESPSKEDFSTTKPVWIPEPSNNVLIEQSPPLSRCDYIVSSGSPPTRDKLKCEEKAKVRRDWRNERLRDIAVALTDRSPESSLALPAEGLLHLKKGWLWIKSDNDWSKRWCVLCGPTFSTFRDQDESGFPEVVIELSSVTGFNEISLDTRYGFQIHYLNSTLTVSAVTAGIRTNWLQSLKKAVPNTPETPPLPTTPRSILLSSDEEYRTASEGGRRGSEDWGELPPSPPLIRTTLTRVKERARARPRLPRSQSRQSTLDSVSTDELDFAKDNAEIELRNTLNKQSAEIDDLKKQLSSAVNEVQNLESELARLKKNHAESLVREKQSKELLVTLEKNEHELNKIIRQADEKHLRDQRNLQSRLNDVESLARDAEQRCQVLSQELQIKESIINNLQEELQVSSEQLSKNNQENEGFCNRLLEGLSKQHLNSLSDLADINLYSNLEYLSRADLLKQCLDLRSRFEKSIEEIRAMKKELRDSYIKYDDLELQNVNLQTSLEITHEEAKAHSILMANRLQDLTNKLLTAEKQARSLKSKLQDSREKRRSLSLKGRESVSVSKEMEDKVNELEAKILTIEKSRYRKKSRRERSSERTSPTDDRSSPAQRSLRRLRRKSLDSATTSEPMKLLIRLSALESRVSSVANSSDSLNYINNASESNDADNKSTSDEITFIKERLNECLNQIVLLKNGRSKRAASPSIDKLNCVENALTDISGILHNSTYLISLSERDVVDSSASSVVTQLENLLKNKLNDLYKKKQLLKNSGQLDTNAELSILAEKVAYENVLVGYIQECLNSSTTREIYCDRLLNKELSDTSKLIYSLQAKLDSGNANDTSNTVSGVDYLVKVLRNCLVDGAQSFTKNKILKCFKVEKHLLESLQEKHAQLNIALNTYKAAKLPHLADALANETISLSMDTSCRLKDLDHTIINDAWSAAQDSINSELLQSEINHIMIRAAQIYEVSNTTDHNYFFSFFASERAALELWSDAVEEHLNEEMQKNIDELNEYYQNSLNKMQRQNWRRRLESERIGTTANILLREFSDVVAHKALIDAKISVLSGRINQVCSDDIDEVDVFNNGVLTNTLKNNRILSDLEKSELVQINRSLSAEFKCMFETKKQECLDIINQFNLEQVVCALNELSEEVSKIQNFTNGGFDDKVAIIRSQINSWDEVCDACKQLKNSLIIIRNFINNQEFCNAVKISDNEEDKRSLYLGTEYLAKIENLRATYRRTLSTFTGHLKQSNVEQLQLLCDQILMAMEHWHRRTLQDLRESHISELEVLRQEKEQALAEETQATLAALDAMRKAHEAEVQREVAKFKLDFTRQQQHELLELTERLSVKCLEAAALEEQLGSATRQLAHAQQHILQLERNPQLSDVQN